MNDLFLPMTAEDLKRRNWDGIDILLITGDAYVDHPSFGTPIIGRVLESCGYKVGILAQIDWKDPEALKYLPACISHAIFEFLLIVSYFSEM